MAHALRVCTSAKGNNISSAVTRKQNVLSVNVLSINTGKIYEDFKAISMKITVFCNVTMCCLANTYIHQLLW